MLSDIDTFLHLEAAYFQSNFTAISILALLLGINHVEYLAF